MLLGILTGVLLSFIGFIIALVVGGHPPLLEVMQATAAIAVAISATVGLNLYLTTLKRHKSDDRRKASQEYLQEAINLLDRSFEVFTDKGACTDPPRNSRVLWLTTSRMLLRYYRIRDRIVDRDHIQILREHEEYWRLQFYNVLDRNRERFDLMYLQPMCEKCGDDVSHMDSIGIIFDFARAPDDDDGLGRVDVVSMHARGVVPPDQVGIWQFIEQDDEYREKIRRKREALGLGK